MSILIFGCTTGYQHVPAPVVDRMKPTTDAVVASQSQSADVPVGQYVVKPGDTLIRIGLEQGQNWRDIARWNNIDNPDRIEVGQVIRIQPPLSEAASADVPGVVVTPVTRASVIEPVNNMKRSDPSAESAIGSDPSAKKPGTPVPAESIAEARKSTSPATPLAAELSFVMPSKGPVISSFDGVKNKGVDIAGKLGDPIVAAADGRVVYSGAGLRGYGNLIIIKHNNTYLTAYAHNDKLLVKEDQFIKQGQKIAEMGNSESDQVKLHFEIRKMGKPVDPLPLIPVK